MTLRVKVTPNSSRDEILGWEDLPNLGMVLKVKIKSPPVDGKANRALRTFLAKSLKVAKSEIRQTHGTTSRIKTFIIPDGTIIASG